MFSFRQFLAISVAASYLSSAVAFSIIPPLLQSSDLSKSLIDITENGERAPSLACRRDFLVKGLSLLSASTLLSQGPQAGNAFENRLDDKYVDVTPQTGTQPTGLGHLERASRTKGSYTGLKQCGTSPNCWCSSVPFSDSPARFIPAWEGNAIQDVKKVIDTYEVGQNGVDGGGFEIIDYNEGDKYIYVQFQSYKNGYIDDFECWYNPLSQKFDVRSASRIGMSDLGVNAKRLEYIGGRLEKEFGWKLERRKNGSLV